MKNFVGLAILCAVSAAAQGPGPGFPWWDSPIVRNLNLTEDQQKQIRATVRDYRDRLIELRAAAEKAEGALQDAMSEDPVDEAKANQAIERVVAARGDMMRTVSQMSVKLRKVLTPAQWQELQKRRPADMRKKFRDRRMRRSAPDEPGRPPDPPSPGGADL
jgi:Spy/CpxP family protein refolding chaperone